MKHFVMGEYDQIEQDVNTDNFFKELERLYKKYNISISHEDGHGSFILEKFDEDNVDWIESASIQPDLRDILNNDNKDTNINIEAPCNIGDTVYIVEDYNPYYDKCKYYETKYNTKIVIKPFVVEAFIIDSNGIFIADEDHDGMNRLKTYHDLTLEKFEDCKVFYNMQEAIDFVTSVSK